MDEGERTETSNFFQNEYTPRIFFYELFESDVVVLKKMFVFEFSNKNDPTACIDDGV